MCLRYVRFGVFVQNVLLWFRVFCVCVMFVSGIFLFESGRVELGRQALGVREYSKPTFHRCRDYVDLMFDSSCLCLKTRLKTMRFFYFCVCFMFFLEFQVCFRFDLRLENNIENVWLFCVGWKIQSIHLDTDNWLLGWAFLLRVGGYH